MIRRALLLVVLLVSPLALHAAEKPSLLLHFDLNKTIVAFDTSLGKTREDVIIHCLADTYTDKWSPEVQTPISYSDYVKGYLLRGPITDPDLKKARDRKISEFLLFLQSTNHPLYEKVRREYDHALAALTSQKTIVMSSFYSLVDFLQKNGYTFSIIIRTFGTDYDRACPEIEQRAHIHFSKKGHFQKGILFVDGDGSLSQPKEFYDVLMKNQHVVIHDDWLWWAEHGETQPYGKPFPVDMGDKKTLSLFFDDNIFTEEHSERNIVNPIDVTTNKALDVFRLIRERRIFPVETLQAIENDDYYVSLVKEALGICERPSPEPCPLVEVK